MNKRKYKLVNTYLSEVLFHDLEKMDSKLSGEVMYFNYNDTTIMIEGNFLKLSKKIWYELTEHFSLNVYDVHMVMVGWLKENYGITKRLVMAECSYTRTTLNT